MRLTCLRCGHQVETATKEETVTGTCVCGLAYASPEVVNTGTCPNERAAERSRFRAFRAAGVVKNVGGVALGISLLGVLCFPIGIVGAGIGAYLLATFRGCVGRYSGRRAAAAAVVIGSTAFVGEGALALSWLHSERAQDLVRVQESAVDDLRALLRAERLYRAAHDTYGSLAEVRYVRPHADSKYAIYVSADDVMPARRDGVMRVDPLPAGIAVGTSENSFTAAAVGNLDSDPVLDVWTVTDRGDVRHERDDLAN